MTIERDLRRGLQEAENAYEKLGLPTEADVRLSWRLAALRKEKRARVRWRTALGLAAAVGAASVAVVFALERAEPRGAGAVDHGPAAALLSGPLAVWPRTEGVREERGGEVSLPRGPVAVATSGFDGIVDSLESSRVKHEPDGLRLVRGRVLVRVTKRPRSAPVRIHVSHGVVEVLGTRFELEQGEHGGAVRLFEGVIRFADGASVRTLTPGQSLRWPATDAGPLPERGAPLPGPTPSARTAPGRVAARPDVRTPARPGHRAEGVELGTLLDEVAALRTRGQYDAAAQTLRTALRRSWRKATQERLSFELATIVSGHLAGLAGACAPWRVHARRFERGRYASEVRAVLARLGCEEDGAP